MASYTFFVPDDPVPKGRARITKTGHAYTPTRTLQSEWRIRQNVSNQGWIAIEGPVALSLIVALTPPAMPKKWQGFRKPTKRPDLDNYIKTVLDALNGIVFKDDSQVVHLNARKVYVWPENELRPGWYIDVSDVDS